MRNGGRDASAGWDVGLFEDGRRVSELVPGDGAEGGGVVHWQKAVYEQRRHAAEILERENGRGTNALEAARANYERLRALYMAKPEDALFDLTQYASNVVRLYESRDRPRVSLTPEQMARADAEGLRRHTVNIANGVRPTPDAPKDEAEAQRIHILGARGELGAAVYYGVEDRVFNTLTAEAGRGVGDIDGTRIDVKATARKNPPWLQVWKRSAAAADKIFLLVVVDAPDVELQGWIDGEELIDKANLQDIGGGSYRVPVSRLNGVDSLWPYLG